jgi:hypothetical protein
MLFDFIDFFLVTPAKAGVHLIDQVVEKVDTGLRRYDGERAKKRGKREMCECPLPSRGRAVLRSHPITAANQA